MEPILAASGLTTRQMQDPTIRLKVRDQIHFLNLVSHALADDLLGFHLALIPDLREFGLFYYVMASAETLIEALQRAVRYTSIVNEGIAQRWVDRGHLGISIRYVGVHRHLDRHQIEFWLTALVRVCRKLTGVHVLPRRVRLVHYREHRPAEFDEFFGDDVQFSATTDEIVFPKKVGNLPVCSADPYLNKLLVEFCEEALRHRARHLGSFKSSVVNAVVPLLPHGRATIPEIARRIGIGERTFARRLSSEGLTFSDLLQGLRFDLAHRYLADSALSISQIAWLLGYQEVGGFSHAFKRWTGKTPRQTRTRDR